MDEVRPQFRCQGHQALFEMVDDVDCVDDVDKEKIHSIDCVHFVHNVHSVHCLRKSNWIELPNLGSSTWPKRVAASSKESCVRRS